MKYTTTYDTMSILLRMNIVLVIHNDIIQDMTTREMKFIKAKIKGESNTKAAMIATGTKSINSAKTLGHRLSTNVNVQQALAKALQKHEITIDKALAPISKALTAQTRVVEYKKTVTKQGKKSVTTSEPIEHYEDNLDMQLRGSDRAVKLLGLDKQPDIPDSPNVIDNEALMEAIKSGDMVTLQQIIFNKGS